MRAGANKGVNMAAQNAVSALRLGGHSLRQTCARAHNLTDGRLVNVFADNG